MYSYKYYDEAVDSPLLHCWQRSHSVLLHIPQIELMFALVALQGAIAAEISLLRSHCPSVRLLSYTAIIVFPLLFTVIACLVLRAVTCGAIEYVSEATHDQNEQQQHTTNSNASSGSAAVAHTSSDTVRDSTPAVSTTTTTTAVATTPVLSVCTKAVQTARTAVAAAWHSGDSMFEKCASGRWKSPAKLTNEHQRIMTNSFMIGFQPLYADFTASGAYYTVLVVLRLLLYSLIVAFVNNSAAACGALIALLLANVTLILWWRPFNNSILQVAEVVTLCIDALTVALTLWSSLISRSHGSSSSSSSLLHHRALFYTFAALQCIGFFVVALPFQIDTLLTAAGKGYRKFMKLVCKRASSQHAEVKQTDPTVRCVTGKWQWLKFWRYWWLMIRLNVTVWVSTLLWLSNCKWEHYHAPQLQVRAARVWPRLPFTTTKTAAISEATSNTMSKI
jgi:hypothetical protein